MPTPTVVTPLANVVHHVVADAVAAVHTVTGDASPGQRLRSSVSDDPAGPVSSPEAAVTTQVASRTAVLSLAAVTPAAAPVTPAAPLNPIAALVGVLTSLVNPFISPNPGVPPTNPLQLLLFNIVQSFEYGFGLLPISTNPGPGPVSTSLGVPAPTDVAQTAYGDIGKWMLQSNGQLANFGGQMYGGKTLLEPVNVIIVDPTSKTPEESAAKLDAALTAAGFPSQLGHSGGFQGTIDGKAYSQQPTYFLQAYSDNFFLFPGDHARVFGPAPAPGGGYVWTAAASREAFGLYGIEPTHTYVSYDLARDELAKRLVDSGATMVGDVPLGNAYNTTTVSTGDNNGYAVVVRLT